MIYQDTNTAYQAKKKFQKLQSAASLEKWHPFSNLYLDKNYNLSISLEAATKSVQALQVPVARVFNELMQSLSEQHRSPTQIDCYLYSSLDQVHVFSFDVENIKPSKQQKALMLRLVLARLSQLKLVFPISCIQMRCEQSFSFGSLVTQ